MKRIWVIALVAACTRSDPAPAGGDDAVCGDGTCNVGETIDACPEDCALCGDGVCSSTETLDSCRFDCAICGDGMCDGPETVANCPHDCSVCGDAMCTGAETVGSCAVDCSVCGDATCTGPETLESCADDCSVCGDLSCTGPETMASCPDDCAATLAVKNQSTFTIYHLYAWHCGDTSMGPDLLGSTVLPQGSTLTLTSVAPGCWNFYATDAASSVSFSKFNILLLAAHTFTWTLF